MGKIKIIGLLFLFIALPSFAQENLPNYIGEKPKCTLEIFQDELLENLSVQKPVKNSIFIEDELLKGKTTPKVSLPTLDYLEDELVLLIDKSKVKTIEIARNQDFSSIDRIIIPMKINKLVTSNEVQSGDKIFFIITQDIKINNKITIPQGTKISAIVEYALPGQLKGEAGSMIVDKFKIEGFDEFSPDGKISLNGANRRFWILPLAKAMNALTIVGGYPLYLIKGGPAKITPNKEYSLYLWGKY